MTYRHPREIRALQFNVDATSREFNELMVAIDAHPLSVAFMRAHGRLHGMIAVAKSGLVTVDQVEEAYMEFYRAQVKAFAATRQIHEDLLPQWDERLERERKAEQDKYAAENAARKTAS